MTIGSPCQGSEELIDCNGFVTDASHFGEKIEFLAMNSAEREKMGEQSTHLIEEVLSWHNTATRYLQLFDKLAK